MATVIPSGESSGGQEAVFPPFDSATFTSTIFWLVMTFGVLYLIMSRTALPRVKEILRTRSAQIHGDLAAARSMREEALAASQAYDKTLGEARARSQALAAETRAKVKLQQDAKRTALEADLSHKLQAADARIADMKTAAMANVGQIATEAASSIVEHITGRPADADAVARAIADAA